MVKESRSIINSKNGKLGGRPKGKKMGKTLEREAAIDRIRQIVYKNTDRLLATQLSMAVGTMHIVKIEKVAGVIGSSIVKDEKELPHAMKCILDPDLQGRDDESDSVYYHLRTDKPDERSVENLLDRAHGKPAQSIDLGNRDDKPFLISVDE